MSERMAGRRSAPPASPRDPSLTLALVAAAIRSGASIPRALETVGSSAESPALTRAGRLLLLGAGWEEAWRGSEMDSAARLVSRALEPSWLGGVDPVPLLERAAATWQARRDRRAREAAARLGVRLVLPLGLCYLPAFLMVSVLPVMLASGTQILMP